MITWFSNKLAIFAPTITVIHVFASWFQVLEANLYGHFCCGSCWWLEIKTITQLASFMSSAYAMLFSVLDPCALSKIGILMLSKLCPFYDSLSGRWTKAVLLNFRSNTPLVLGVVTTYLSLSSTTNQTLTSLGKSGESVSSFREDEGF